jgi:hypothetical protein
MEQSISTLFFSYWRAILPMTEPTNKRLCKEASEE